MITNDNDQKSTSASDEQSQTVQANSQIDHSKRRLTKAGLAASGVMLTLASKSVLAGRPTGKPTGRTAIQCTSPSGFTSLNVSAPGKHQSACLGRSPGMWAQWPELWISLGYDPGVCTATNGTGMCASFDPNTGTPFHSGVMGRSYPSGFPGFSGTKFGTRSMMAVMVDNSGTDESNVAMHAVATVLNIANNWMPPEVMTMTTILGIWQSYITLGHYEPTAGVKWYGADIVAYLKSTMS